MIEVLVTVAAAGAVTAASVAGISTGVEAGTVATTDVIVGGTGEDVVAVGTAVSVAVCVIFPYLVCVCTVCNEFNPT